MPSFRMVSGRNQSWTRGVPSAAMTSTVSDCSFDQPLFNLVSQLKSGHLNLSGLLERRNQEIERLKQDLERKTSEVERERKISLDRVGKIDKLEADKGGLMKTVDAIQSIFSRYERDLSSILQVQSPGNKPD